MTATWEKLRKSKKSEQNADLFSTAALVTFTFFYKWIKFLTEQWTVHAKNKMQTYALAQHDRCYIFEYSVYDDIVQFRS